MRKTTKTLILCRNLCLQMIPLPQRTFRMCIWQLTAILVHFTWPVWRIRTHRISLLPKIIVMWQSIHVHTTEHWLHIRYRTKQVFFCTILNILQKMMLQVLQQWRHIPKMRISFRRRRVRQ